MFQLVELTGASAKEFVPVLDDEGEPIVFPDGKEAAEAAKAMSADTGKRIQPRRMPANKDWREREAAKFESGEYERPFWERESQFWFDSRMEENPELLLHFAHVAKGDRSMIAYTPNDEYGEAGRTIRVKPGRYLEQFHSGLGAEFIRSWATRWASEYCPPTLYWATTADEFEEVYTNGPNSCMGHPADEYNSPVHPVRVYAAGDIHLAYLKADGCITARVLVNIKTKRYGRVYGDNIRLENLLDKQGYRYSSSALNGCRLVRIPDDRWGERFVCPYIDGVGTVSDEEDYPLIGGYGFDAQHTDGWTGEDNSIQCDECGDHVHEDDACYLDSRGVSVCRACYNDLTFHCDYYDERMEGECVIMANGDTWSERAFDNYGGICEATGDNYSLDDLTCLADGTYWNNAYFAEHGFVCADTGDCFPNSQGVEIDGEMYCRASAVDILRERGEDLPPLPSDDQLEFPLAA